MTVNAAISLLLALIDQSATISAAIKAAQAAGQTTLSADQWTLILKADSDARTALIAALSAAK